MSAVNDVAWIQARGNNECVSVSTDGTMLWWDVRSIAKGPIDTMRLKSADPSSSSASASASASAGAAAGGGGMVYGATALEYKSEAGVCVNSPPLLVGRDLGREEKSDLLVCWGLGWDGMM